jgi:CheY-like chemotaxis protein
VLVADDDKDVRTMLRTLLELDGHDVMEARDGEEAWRRCVESQPAVVVADMSSGVGLSVGLDLGYRGWMPADANPPDPTEADLQADKLVAGLGRALAGLAAAQRASSEAIKGFDYEKRIEVWLTAQRQLLPILASRGWVPSMRIMPRDIVELLKVYNQQGGEALDQQMVELCAANSVKSMANSATGAFAGWGAVFAKAARAHENGDYELAVPIWLLSIEGIVGTALGERDLFKKVRQKKVQSRVADRLRIGKSVGASAFSEFSEAWVSALSTVALPTEKATPAILNRNAVLHGLVPRVGTERDSVQGMLFLDLFKFLFDETGR